MAAMIQPVLYKSADAQIRNQDESKQVEMESVDLHKSSIVTVRVTQGRVAVFVFGTDLPGPEFPISLSCVGSLSM